MKAKNALTNLGSITAGGNVLVGDPTTNRVGKASKRAAYYPPGCIGADLAKRNYVRYLVERYHEHREADVRFGRTDRFHYSVIFKNIEARFQAPTYFIPEARFEELADYLQGRIDNTMLGRVNAKRGIANYESFDEYVMQHMAAPVAG
ncbi:MAG: hypothetical protein HYY24_15350 [Verrucomicrobia bacterium]|nr:hypothetical protein [Verrucomicrobiota bacterium]